MSEQRSKHVWLKWRLTWQALLGLSLLAAALIAAWYLTSPQFVNAVRNRLVAELETVTGGRVELKSIRWNLSQLTFEAHDLTIHGLEAPNDVPYAHIDKLSIRGKLVSLWRRKIDLRDLELDRPVFHLIIHPDGTTNQPGPMLSRRQGDKDPVQRFVDLAIGRIVFRDGLLIINERMMPLDFAANNVNAGMTYDVSAKRYDGSVSVAKFDTKLRDMRPISASVNADFSLYANKVEVKAFHLSTGRSKLEATAALTGFAAPRIEGRYKASIDVRELGATIRQTSLRGGQAEVEGPIAFAGSEFQSSGALNLNRLEYSTPSAHVRDLAFTAQYSLDQRQVVLSSIKGNVFGGGLTGGVTIENWLKSPLRAAPEPTLGKGTKPTLANADERGTARLQLTNANVANIAAAGSSPSLRLDRMGFAGLSSGNVDVQWRGNIKSAVAKFAMEIAPPVNIAPETLPVSGAVQGTYHAADDIVTLTNADIKSPSSHLQASGSMGVARNGPAKLRVAFRTENLGEIQPILVALDRSSALPIDLHGSASFDGAVAGSLKAPQVEGRVEIRDFDSLLALPPSSFAGATPASTATTEAPPARRRMHWDHLSADLHYGPKSLAVRNGSLKEKNTAVEFSGSASLNNGSFLKTSPFSADINLHNAQLTDVNSIAGIGLPATGLLSLKAHLSGTRVDPNGSGHAVIRNAVVYGEPVRQLTANFAIACKDVQVRSFDIVHIGARITGSGAYNLDTHEMRFDVRSRRIDLATIKLLQARLPVGGTVALNASGSGTREAPTLNANVSVRNLVVRGEPVGDLNAEAVTVGDQMRVTARSGFGNSEIEGTVRLRDNFPGDFKASLNRLDIDPFLRGYIRGRLTGHSIIAGTVTAKGPLLDPKQWTVNADLTSASAEIEHVALRNDGPVQFVVANQVLDIKRMRIVGPDTQLQVAGTAGMSSGGRLEIRAEGDLNLKLIQTINPDFASYGLATLTARIVGTWAEPNIRGQVQITNGGISYIDMPNGLSDINGLLVFNRDRVQVSNMTAKTGGGTLQLSGFVTYGRTSSINLSAKANEIRLRYPPGVSAVANGDLRLTGSPNYALLSGDVTVTRFGLNPRFDFGAYLAQTKQTTQTVPVNPLLGNLRLDLHVSSTPELQVFTSLAKISGNADLRIRGTAARPIVLGRVSVIEGDVFINGTKYRLERGDLTFSNPVRIEPVINVQATTTVRNYDIALGFHGPLDKMSTTYRSDPPLSSKDIVFLLAFGRTREDNALATTPTPNAAESDPNAFLSQALNSAVTSRVQRIFGVTRVKVDPRVGGAENNPSGARVTVEQQVANNVTLTYITDLTRATQQVIQLEYNINRNVSIVAVRNEYGVVSIDLRVRQRRR